MSYGIMPYLVSTADMKAWMASGDAASVQSLVSANKSEIDSLDGLFYDFYDDEAPYAKDLLTQFVTDSVPADSGLGAAYGYTFKFLCEHFGRFLSNSEWYPCSWDQMDLFDGIASYGLPIRFPSPDDFPVIRWIDGSKAEAHLAKLADTPSTGADYAEFKGWLEQAQATGKDLYLFYH